MKTHNLKSMPSVDLYLAQLNEEQLTGDKLSAHLQNIVMAFWHELTSPFLGNPDQYDIHQHGIDGPYRCLKMTPGADVIDTVFDRVDDRAGDLTKALNKAFNTTSFSLKVRREGGELDLMVAFTGAEGGIFTCNSTENGGSFAVALRIPNEEELKVTFDSMAQVPTPSNVMGGEDELEAGPEHEVEPELDLDDIPETDPELDIEPELEEGAYVGGEKHTWPNWIGGINSKKAKAIKKHLTKKGHIFDDHGETEDGKSHNTHYISMKTKEGHAELEKAKKKLGLGHYAYGTPGHLRMQDHKGKADKEDLPTHVKHDSKASYMKEEVKLSEGVDDNSFDEIKNRIIDQEIDLAREEGRESQIKSFERLRSISDPAKFVSQYKRLTGATDFDLGDDMLSLIEVDMKPKKQIKRPEFDTEPFDPTDEDTDSADLDDTLGHPIDEDADMDRAEKLGQIEGTLKALVVKIEDPRIVAEIERLIKIAEAKPVDLDVKGFSEATNLVLRMMAPKSMEEGFGKLKDAPKTADRWEKEMTVKLSKDGETKTFVKGASGIEKHKADGWEEVQEEEVAGMSVANMGGAVPGHDAGPGPVKKRKKLPEQTEYRYVSLTKLNPFER